MLAQARSDRRADVAAKVADAGGMSLGPATMFTGVAISRVLPGGDVSDRQRTIADPAGAPGLLGGQTSNRGRCGPRPSPSDRPRAWRHSHGMSMFWGPEHL